MPQAQVKIAQISKDFNIKSKDVIDSFKELGIDKKVGGSADSEEYELFLQHLTTSHQIKNLDAYRSGKVKITLDSKPKKAEPQEKPASAPAPKAEPKIEKKAEPKVEKKAEPKPQPKPEQRFEKRDGRNPADKPRQDSQRDQRRDARPSYQKYNAAPQENPFAKKHDSMNRAAQGFKAPGSQQGKPADKKFDKPIAEKPKAAAAAPAPVAEKPQSSTLRPAQQAQLEKQKAKQQAPAQAPVQQKPKKEEKRAQKQQFKTITPTVDRSNVKGGVNIGAE